MGTAPGAEVELAGAGVGLAGAGVGFAGAGVGLAGAGVGLAGPGVGFAVGEGVVAGGLVAAGVGLETGEPAYRLLAHVARDPEKAPQPLPSQQTKVSPPGA